MTNINSLRHMCIKGNKTYKQKSLDCNGSGFCSMKFCEIGITIED